MPQIINDPSLGSSLGSAFGTGLSGLLQNLAVKKAQSMANRETASGLQALGFSPEQAASVAKLNPSLQQSVVKQHLEAPQQQAFAQSLQSILGGPQAGQLSPEEAQQAIPGVGQPGAGQPGAAQQQEPTIPAGLNPQQAMQLAQLAMQKQAQERKIQSQEELEGRRESEKFYTKSLEESREARDSNKRLSRMKELNEKGSLGLPLVNSLVKTLTKGIGGFGIDLSGLLSADSQEFDKLSADFVKGAKTFFGSRLTDADLNAFMKTIPNLTQSKEARKRLINTLEETNNVKNMRRDIMVDIVKKEGKRPADLESRVEKKLDKKINKIASEVKSMTKGVPAYKPEGPGFETLESGSRSLQDLIYKIPGVGPLVTGAADALTSGITKSFGQPDIELIERTKR